MLIGKAALARMIPHAGAMCLLAAVREIDAHRIVCVATSHADRDNPLRRRGGLPAVCGIEYASQAMAVHGAWMRGDGDRGQPGMLATVREATWQVQLLDGLGPELVVEAALDADNARSASYRFALRDGSVLLLEGRATVVFAAS